ncbi:MAG: hypothetical protein ACI9YT_000054 [Halobacteriales archaeon]|jgi:hypothetical protein
MVDVRFEVLCNGRVDLPALAATGRRPAPFTPGAEFWTDPYRSERLLEAHLDETHGAASRPPDRIDADFGTFGPEDRRTVLDRVRTALGDDGYFAFDVLPTGALPDAERKTEWKLRGEAGEFWRPDPHLVLSASAAGPETAVALDQHLVVEPDGAATIYRFWQQHYSPESTETLLSSCGFDLEGPFPDLQGGSGPGVEDEELLGVVATVTSQ